MRPLLDPSQLVKFNPPRVLSITIPAESESDVVPVTGRYIYPKEASYSKFDVRFDEGGYVPADLAFGFRVPDYMQAFRQVQFRNRNEVPITIEVIVGEIEVDDRRTNYIASRDGTAASYVPNGAQYLGYAEIGTPLTVNADPNRACLLLTPDDVGPLTMTIMRPEGALWVWFVQAAEPIVSQRFEFKGACQIIVSTGPTIHVNELCYS